MFGQEEMVHRYLAAWNARKIDQILKSLHPKASFYDAFWGETCAGADLQKYLRDEIQGDHRWYRPEGRIFVTSNGMAARYSAFDRDDEAGIEPVYSGVEVFTITDGLIRTISDFYADPDPEDLVEIAERSELMHSAANSVVKGLSARSAGRIKRRLDTIANDVAIIRDPKFSVTRLADMVGCSVMHLFHVLEEELGNSFNSYIGECRARYASSLLLGHDISAGDLETIAYQAGFESLPQFLEAFENTFGTSPYDYMQQFSGRASNSN